MTIAATHFQRPTTTWRRWQQHAFGYREAAIATLVFGIYLHASRLVFGDEFLLRYLLTPRVDELLGTLMIYTVAAGFAGWSALSFRSARHRRISKFILGFILVSVPIHLATFLGASPARVTVAPMWYSAVEATLIYPAFALAVWNIRYRCEYDR